MQEKSVYIDRIKGLLQKQHLPHHEAYFKSNAEAHEDVEADKTINIFTLRFQPELEEKFVISTDKTVFQNVRFIRILGIFAFLGLVLYNILLLSFSEDISASLSATIYILLGLDFMCLILIFSPLLVSNYYSSVFGCMLFVGVSKTFSITDTGSFGLILYALLTLVVFRGKFLFCILACFFDLLIYNGYHLLSDFLSLKELFIIDTLYVFFFIVSNYNAYRFEKALRFQYLFSHKFNAQKKETEELLNNVLPPEVMQVLLSSKQHGHQLKVIANAEPAVTIFFCDIMRFLELTAQHKPSFVVSLLDAIYTLFDELCTLHGITKMETVNKTYMAVCGLGVPENTRSRGLLARSNATKMINFAMEMIKVSKECGISIRIGINSGKVISGLVGHHRPQFCLFGDSVNMASRMQSTGIEGHIQVTEETYELLTDDFVFQPRSVSVKGKGELTAYILGDALKNKRSRSFKHIRSKSSGVGNESPLANHELKRHSTGDQLSIPINETSGYLSPRTVLRAPRANIPGAIDDDDDDIGLSSLSKSVDPIVYEPATPRVPDPSPAGRSKRRWSISGFDFLGGNQSQSDFRHMFMREESTSNLMKSAIISAANQTEDEKPDIVNVDEEDEEDLRSVTSDIDENIDLQLELAQFVQQSMVGEAYVDTAVDVDVHPFSLAFFLPPKNFDDLSWSQILGISGLNRPEPVLDLSRRYALEMLDNMRSLMFRPILLACLFFAVSIPIDIVQNDQTIEAVLGFRGAVIFFGALLLILTQVKNFSSNILAALRLVFFIFCIIAHMSVPVLVYDTIPEITALGYLLLMALSNAMDLKLVQVATLQFFALIFWSIIASIFSDSRSSFGFFSTIFFLFGSVIINFGSTLGKDLYMRRVFLLTQRIQTAHASADEFLYHMLPQSIAIQLKEGKTGLAKVHSNVTILYSDLVGFTKFCSTATPVKVVKMLTQIFSNFDVLTDKHNVYKIQTIGDAYVAVSGLDFETLTQGKPEYHAINCVNFGIAMIRSLSQICTDSNEVIQMRVGIHTGSIVAGCLGHTKLRYDIFGTDCIVANLMEAKGRPGSICLTQTTQALIADKFKLEDGIDIQIPSTSKLVHNYFYNIEDLPSEPDCVRVNSFSDDDDEDSDDGDECQIEVVQSMSETPRSVPRLML